MAACTALEAVGVVSEVRPLDTLPAGVELRQVEQDLLATARDRFGETAVRRALAAPSHVIVKRFPGMSPPPPPNAGPDWRPAIPVALLAKEGDRWFAATARGWREADAVATAVIEDTLTSEAFREEPERIGACPDYGASLLLAKLPGREREVRSALCTSQTDKVVYEALRA
ncbi:hypothetical protein GRI75_04435 [Altererythrobacter soli]|uniref:Uncharacterized protein n=1 Tax=Croceibacterium soli TaxID=1739690 RepID=A0A6I4UQ05_9SPHN|nr:hypothetical protein [Croceibacterium soli]MXP40892.1 hypothetical protein [Croceibacterium soli]